jgi:phosphoglycerate dehydrogenase-like enzyme
LVILVTCPIQNPEDRLELERQIREIAGANAEILFSTERDVSRKKVAECEILYGMLPSEKMLFAEALKWWHVPSAGFDNIRAYPSLIQKISVTHSSGSFGKAISEYVMGLILAEGLNLRSYFNDQRRRRWLQGANRNLIVRYCLALRRKLLKEKPPYSARKVIEGAVFLVVGMGDIGQQTAMKAKAFGGFVFGIEKRTMEKPEFLEAMAPWENIGDFLPRADYVILSLPLTEKTKNIIDGSFFNIMKKSAVLVNVSRGEVVNQADLIFALKKRTIRSAILDVTNPEPLPPGNPLWKMKNVYITPHISSMSRTTDQRRNQLVLGLLKRFLAGESLPNAVDTMTLNTF